MPAQDEFPTLKPPSLWTPDGKPKQKCTVRSCKNPASERGLCRMHLGDRGSRRLKEQVQRRGIDVLRKSR